MVFQDIHIWDGHIKCAWEWSIQASGCLWGEKGGKWKQEGAWGQSASCKFHSLSCLKGIWGAVDYIIHNPFYIPKTVHNDIYVRKEVTARVK